MGRMIYLKIPFTGIKVSPLSVAVIFSLLIADFSVYTAIVILCAILHEAGHIASIKLCGGKIFEITVLPFGAVIHSDMFSFPYYKNALVALSGALSNICFAAAGGIVSLFTNDRYTLFFCICNLLLAAVNLVPVKTFDGGVALEALLLMKYSSEKVDAVIDTVTYFAFVFLTFSALGLLIVTECNFSLIIFCIYVFICVYAKQER